MIALALAFALLLAEYPVWVQGPQWQEGDSIVTEITRTVDYAAAIPMRLQQNHNHPNGVIFVTFTFGVAPEFPGWSAHVTQYREEP